MEPINNILQYANYAIVAGGIMSGEWNSLGKNARWVRCRLDKISEDITIHLMCAFDYITGDVYDIMLSETGYGVSQVYRWIEPTIERAYVKEHKEKGVSIDGTEPNLYNIIRSDEQVITLIKESFINKNLHENEESSILESLELYKISEEQDAN